jgi:hypothetical protein
MSPHESYATIAVLEHSEGTAMADSTGPRARAR